MQPYIKVIIEIIGNGKDRIEYFVDKWIIFKTVGHVETLEVGPCIDVDLIRQLFAFLSKF